MFDSRLFAVAQPLADLLDILLEPFPEPRMRGINAALQNHFWFSDVNWDHLRSGGIRSPLLARAQALFARRVEAKTTDSMVEELFDAEVREDIPGLDV